MIRLVSASTTPSSHPRKVLPLTAASPRSDWSISDPGLVRPVRAGDRALRATQPGGAHHGGRGASLADATAEMSPVQRSAAEEKEGFES